MNLPSPRDILGPTFPPSWRDSQATALTRLLNSNRRFNVLALATGVGKTLVGIAYARISGLRSVVLTSTRALQDQYAREMGGIVHDLRGKRNYPCALLLDRGGADYRCDVGPCFEGEACVYALGGCAYFDALRHAASAPIVVTSYANYFSLHETERGDILGPRDLLICDEAHDAAKMIGSYVGASFKPYEIRFPWDARDLDMDGWREWAAGMLSALEGADERKIKDKRDRMKFRDMVRRLGKLTHHDLIPDYRHGDGWAFEPVWARAHTRNWLWREHAKVVLMSATLRPVTVERELGLDEEAYEYWEAPSPFAVERRPITHIRTVRVNHKMSEAARDKWIERVDEILATRRDRRVIIHTVSYDRARELHGRSLFGSAMRVPDASTSSRGMVEAYLRTSNSILVSPSVHTGHDFPDDAARCQIIVKVPYPDTRFGLAAARAASDPDWASRQAVTTLVQMAGRVVRGPQDWGETLIVDDHVLDLYRRHGSMFPYWFRQAFGSVGEVPPPMEPFGPE